MTVAGVHCSTAAYQRIGELASAAYPDEGCGVLVGRYVESRIEVDTATSGRNLNTERSRDRYVLDPDDILRAGRDARARSLDVVGFWHSHPDHPASPSQFDTDHAWVDYAYVICSTTRDGAAGINAFTLVDEQQPFAQVPLVVAPPAPTGAR